MVYALSLHDALPIFTDTATSAHTESLQFIASAGAWDQTSKKFVFPGIARGQAVLTIVDVEDRKSTRLNSSHGYISYAVFCWKKKNEAKIGKNSASQ